MQLFQKQKFFLIFSLTSEIPFKFWTFSKKDDPRSWCISEITDSEKRD